MTYRSWFVWYATFLPTLWGAMLLLSADPLMATPVAALSDLTRGRWILAAMLFGSAILAAAAMTVRIPLGVRITILLPQQFIMIVSALGAAGAVLAGQYADGVQRPIGFIGADQFPAILAAVVHTISILDMHGVFGWISSRLSRSRPQPS